MESKSEQSKVVPVGKFQLDGLEKTEYSILVSDPTLPLQSIRSHKRAIYCQIAAGW